MLLGLKKLSKKSIGDIGENYAERYLKRKRYKVLERNFKNKLGEIDIICSKGDFLCFVEVKSRSSLNFGSPIDAVNYHKQKRIINGAKYYIMKNKISKMNIRFDVIEVFMNKDHKPVSLNHIENAFLEQ